MNDYKGAIEKYGIITFTPGGNSMWPFIKNGESSIVAQSPCEIKKYDVVLYKRGSRTVFHRVLKVCEDGSYSVCGDNQWTIEKVFRSQIFGVMKGYYIGDKYIDVNNNKKYLFLVRLWCASLSFRKLILIYHNHILAKKKK